MRMEKDGTRTILADRYEGKRFSGPNDVTVEVRSAPIYFTDGNSGLRGGASSPPRELAQNGFYLIKDGKSRCSTTTGTSPTPSRTASRSRRTNGTST